LKSRTRLGFACTCNLTSQLLAHAALTMKQTKNKKLGQGVSFGVPVASVQKTSLRVSRGKSVEENEGHFPRLSWAKTLAFLHV